MRQSIVHVALVVRDYDEAIAFFTRKLKFTLVEDQYQPEQDKRWVVVAPPGSRGTSLLLARASQPEQEPFVGNQAGGRVFLFLSTDDFWRDYREMVDQGVRFVRPPSEQPYGLVAVFEDLYGNRWDLVQYCQSHTLPMPRPRKKKSSERKDRLVTFCRALPGATEDVKWGDNLIFSVGGKMFAGFQLPEGQPLAFKVEPLAFAGLVGHNGIIPAPYMAKHHWISVPERTALPVATLEDLLSEAHRLVAEKLPRKTRQALGLLRSEAQR